MQKLEFDLSNAIIMRPTETVHVTWALFAEAMIVTVIQCDFLDVSEFVRVQTKV